MPAYREISASELRAMERQACEEHLASLRAYAAAPACQPDNSPAQISKPARSSLNDGVDEFLSAMFAKVSGKPRAEQRRLLEANIKNWGQIERDLADAARSNRATPHHLRGLNAWKVARCRLALGAMLGQVERRAA